MTSIDETQFKFHRHTGEDGTQRLPARHVASAVLKGTEAATAANYGRFYAAPVPLKIVSISEVHGTAGSDAGAVTLQVERLQGTEALASGDQLLKTAFNLKATANTVVRYQAPLLSASGTARAAAILSVNDRLALKLSGTPTAVDDVVVSVEMLEF